MFERRLKIFLGVLVLLSAVLLSRAIVIQVGRHDYWTKRAAGLLETRDTTETTRGRILDRDGVVMAQDQPCTDAAVDYRAITSPPDPDWVDDISLDRLKARLGPDVWKHTPRAQRRAMVVQEGANTRADIDRMWDKLALFYKPTDELAATDPHSAIADLRAGIIQKVEMERRSLWFNNFQKNQVSAAEAPRWQRWLAGGSGVEGPDIDRFVIEVDDEKRPHVVLAALDEAATNYLGKRLEQFPGLVLQPSIRRQYPLQTTACHILGRMSRVDKADVLNSQKAGVGPAREYLPNDEIGREGIEAMCEPLLRGSRGQIERRAGTDEVVDQTMFVPGQDVRLTIDSKLQADVQGLFKSFPVRFRTTDPETLETTSQDIELHDVHGAAVVIDVPTGEVRALASNPDFNLDQLDDQYHLLMDDRLGAPLRNRATSDQLEPGSSVKPMIGLSAITQGVIKPLEGIECTGDLYLPVKDEDGNFTNRKARQVGGRCWVASEFSAQLKKAGLLPVHHPMPIPHVGHDGNPDGFLTYRDALERSCNIFFETTADRLGPAGIAYWYKQFGFGMKTGIGIFEQPGRRPDQFPGLMVMGRMTNCFAGIGQSHVWATPLQIANEAATIARGGKWMRPRLLSDAEQEKLDGADSTKASDRPADHDLHLDPAGLEQAKLGMQNVVYSRSGTGRQLMFPNDSQAMNSEEPDPILSGIRVAGKTGTAEAARLWEVELDASGKPVIDAATGKPKRKPRVPSTVNAVSTDTPWYWSSDTKGTTFVHAWFMGYAPVENPQIAFAVLVEYSPTGGGSASGSIARRLLERCVARGYLHPALTMTASR